MIKRAIDFKDTKVPNLDPNPKVDLKACSRYFDQNDIDQLMKAFEVPDNVLFNAMQELPKDDPRFKPNDKVMSFDIETMGLDWNRGCNHRWKPYIGFSESYQYCEKCSEKKALEDS